MPQALCNIDLDLLHDVLLFPQDVKIVGLERPSRFASRHNIRLVLESDRFEHAAYQQNVTPRYKVKWLGHRPDVEFLEFDEC